MKAMLAALILICPLVLVSQLNSAQQTSITGAVAYTEMIQFDYTKDGTKSRVQFWLKFNGSPALGKPGEAGYKPEAGNIYYYLVDVEKKKQVDNWLMGFSMMEGPPPSGPYPMNNINIRGNTATFTAFGMTWTVIDGGEGYSKDTVKINDGFNVRDMKLFGGDLRVTSAKIDAHAAYQDCIKCHEGPTTAMVAKGGKHNTLGCGKCHIGHPPKVRKPYKGCTACHKPHTNQMAEVTCAQCHRAHTAKEVMYKFNVSSSFCSTCHQKVADVLASNRSKHSKIACVLCHPEKHKATSACQDCHGAPHPEHVMKKIGICRDCHGSAHQLDSARPK